MLNHKTLNEGIQKVGGVSAGVSYAKAVVNGGFNGQSRIYHPRPSKQYNSAVTQKGLHRCGIEYNVIEVDMAWLKDCYVGKTRDPEGINYVKKKFLLEGLLSVSLTAIGGNLVLISGQEGVIFEEVLRNNEKDFQRWFTEIRPWNFNMAAIDRSIWLKIIGVPAHIWDERFFLQVSQSVGTFISINESTRDKVRLDTIRAPITASAIVIINAVVEVKVNGTLYNIRMLEECFGDNQSRFHSDWRYQNSNGNSSEDNDSMANSILRVSETEMYAGERDDDIDRLNKEFPNSLFGKILTPKEKGSIRCKTVDGGALGDREVQSTLNVQKELTLIKSGEEHVSNTEYEFQKEGRILENPTNLLEEVGRRVKFVEENGLGLAEQEVNDNKKVGCRKEDPTQSIVFAENQKDSCTKCLADNRCASLENLKVIGLDDIQVSSVGRVGEPHKTDCNTIRDVEHISIEDIEVGVVYHKTIQNGATNKVTVFGRGRSRKKELHARVMSSAFLATRCDKAPLEVYLNEGKNFHAHSNDVEVKIWSLEGRQ